MMCYTVSAFKTYKASLIFLLRVMSEREDVALKCVTRNTSTVQTAVLDTFLRRRVKTPSFDSLSAKLLSTSQESFGGCRGTLSDGWTYLLYCDNNHCSDWSSIYAPEIVYLLVLSCFYLLHLRQIVCWLFFSAGLHKNSRMDSYVMYVEDGSQPSIGCTNIWFGSA